MFTYILAHGILQLLIGFGLMLISLFCAAWVGFRRGSGGDQFPRSAPFADRIADADEADDLDRTWVQRAIRLSERFVRGVLIMLLVVGIGWYFWPQLRLRLTSQADTSQPTEGESSAKTPGQLSTNAQPVKPIIEEDIQDWKTYTDTTNLFTLHYPTDWSLTALANLESLQATNHITSAFEIRPGGKVDPSKTPVIRVHVEENPKQQVASSFGSLHPARGTDRTAYILHGMAAVKYKSLFLESKTNRWTTFVEGGRDDVIIVIELLTPVTLDEFDPLYSRAERIIETFYPTALSPSQKPTH